MAEETAPSSSRIFISYRREDTEGHVLALIPQLRERFGDRIFKDTDNIAPGQDFTKVIARELESCSVLLAVIGKDWLSATDSKGNRRLDNSHDYLRLEIATALKKEHVTVIPVLVGRASVPSPDDLPPELQPLAFRNAIELSAGRWREDIERLTRAIEQVCDLPSSAAAGRSSRTPEPSGVPRASANRPPYSPTDDFDLLEARRQRQIAEHLSDARRAFAALDYQATLDACEKVVWLNPQDADARELAHRARVALDEQKIHGSLAQATEVLNRPGLADADLRLASDLIDEALSLNPAHEAASKLREQVLAIRRRRERHRELGRQVQAAVDRAKACFEEEDFDAVIQHCDEALSMLPESAEALELRGKAVAAKKDQRRQRKPEAEHVPLAREAVETAQYERDGRARRRFRLWFSLTHFGRLKLSVQITVATALLAVTVWGSVRYRETVLKPADAPSAAKGATTGTSPPVSSTPLAQQLASLRERARSQYEAGQHSQALDTVVAGLKAGPGDPDLLRLLTSLETDAQSALRNAKQEAATAQAASRAGAEMTRAAQKESEAAILGKNARTEEAIRALWAAAESYSRAAERARQIAAELDAVATRARTQRQSGQSAQALDSALEGLKIDPASARLHDIINALWRDAQSAAERSRRQATERGVSAASSQEFDQALRKQTEAQKLRDANNMGDAIRSLWAANQLFRSADGRPTPPPDRRTEEEQVLEALDDYRSAYNRMNAAAVKRLEPSVVQSQLAMRFAGYRSYSMTITNPHITFAGDTAVVSCTIRTNILPRDGPVQTETRRTILRLQKSDGAWIITERQ